MLSSLGITIENGLRTEVVSYEILHARRSLRLGTLYPFSPLGPPSYDDSCLLVPSGTTRPLGALVSSSPARCSLRLRPVWGRSIRTAPQHPNSSSASAPFLGSGAPTHCALGGPSHCLPVTSAYSCPLTRKRPGVFTVRGLWDKG